MKKLQSNYTTPEQSKRLLELGVPIDSADCYFYTKVDKHPKILTTDKFDWLESPYIPCWSAGRLIEICKICEPKKDYEQLCEELKYCQNYCVLIISHIIANLQIIDFSKLEE